MASPRILVVDDSRTIRTLVQRTLIGAGYDVRTAADGREAMQQVAATNPQLLILDIDMPVMDGYEVCEELRAMGEPWSALPIIFLTHVTSNALSLLGSDMGAYLRKPVDGHRLLREVARFLPGQEPVKEMATVSD